MARLGPSPACGRPDRGGSVKILVIGGSGFLGKHVVAHFQAKGDTVRTLSYRPVRHDVFLDDFQELLARGGLDAVIYAGASQTGRDDAAAIYELSLSNIVLPASMASLLREHAPECCLLTFGTSWQIGEQGGDEPFNAYAASKTGAEAMLAHFAMNGVRSATLRLYDTYGPGDDRNKVVNLIADAINGRSELPMSSGGQAIDLVHIRDVLSAIDATLGLLRDEEPGRHRVFAVRSGQPVTILEVLAELKRVAGMEDTSFIRPGVYPYRPRERFSLFPDTPGPPGWHPRVSLENGLRELLEERRSRA